MATEKTILRILTMLKAAFPDWARSMDQSQEDATTELYLARLRDMPDGLLEETALAWIDRERFFPRVADLKKPERAQVALGLSTPDEAWAACIAGTAAQDSLAVRVFSNLGFNRHDLRLLDYTTVNVCQSNFMRAYREAVAVEQQREALPDSLKAALPDPNKHGQIDGPKEPHAEEPEEGFLSHEEASKKLGDLYAELKALREEKERQAEIVDLNQLRKRRANLKHQVEQLKREAS